MNWQKAKKWRKFYANRMTMNPEKVQKVYERLNKALKEQVERL